MLVFRYAALTDEGRVRKNNEDNYYVDGIWKKDIKQNKNSGSEISRASRLTASVCDGMGGEARGEEASLIAVETISKYDHGEWSGDTVNACIQEANARICKGIRQTGERSGSTMCLLLLAHNKATAINLGDSRIYRYRNHMLSQLTTDHSVVGRMVRQGQLTEDEARKHPRRHQITQYLGIDPKEMALSPAVSGPEEYMEGDRFLICSDGLTDMLTDQEICGVLANEKDTDIAIHQLCSLALAAGGKDNITVVLIDILDDGEEITVDVSSCLSSRQEATKKGLKTDYKTDIANPKPRVPYLFMVLIGGVFCLLLVATSIFRHQKISEEQEPILISETSTRPVGITMLSEASENEMETESVSRPVTESKNDTLLSKVEPDRLYSETKESEETETDRVTLNNYAGKHMEDVRKTYYLVVECGYIEGTGRTKGLYHEGDNVTLVAENKEGYLFTGWTVSNNDVIMEQSGERITIVMPSHTLIVKAQYIKTDLSFWREKRYMVPVIRSVVGDFMCR